jgi:hypothetical protein
MKRFNLINIAISSRFIPLILNLFVVISLFVLPYYLFDGRLFLGGDDTRLHYIFPTEFLHNLSLFSWVNISSLPSYLPNHHSIPFLLIFSFFGQLISSKVQLFYLAFSLPLILGFLYFQKFIKELVEGDYYISFISALIYLFAPITIISQMFNFLFSMYLVALVPIIAYYYTAFLKRGKNVDIYKAIVWSIIFSVAFYAIQWILAVLFPLFLGLILLIFIDNPIKMILKRTIIFCYFILASQLFWILPFVMSLTYKGGNDLGGKIASEGFINSFASTVLSTATGNIIYPLLTFYHRRIAFDYEWHVSQVYTNYFDYVLPFSFIFILILFMGLIKYNDVLTKRGKQIFLFFSCSFILSLYFSTVNIGILKNLFLLLGYIPGFAIFRNFTDKFALAYIFIFATLIALCLFVIKKSYKYYWIIALTAIIAICINIIPIKQMIASPLWKTDHIYTTVNIPQEYVLFTEKVKSVIPNDINVIAFPQNISAYAVITEDNKKHAYVGTSPFKFFTGINDLTGTDSYPAYISKEIHEYISKREYAKLLKLLSNINTGYVMVTKNVPVEVINSYIYDTTYLSFQDSQLINSIVDHEVLRSEKGNYTIYKLKNSPQVINSQAHIRYTKINPILYRIQINGIDKKQKLFLLETYHPGWKLYLSKRNNKERNLYFSDFVFIFEKSIFEATHSFIKPYGNEWTILPEEIIKTVDKSYYKLNKNGSIDIDLYIYFLPQSYFYVGIILSIVIISIGIFFLHYKKNEK